MKLKPCPCCGNTNLFVGCETSSSMAVVCWSYEGGCGLRMYVNWMDRIGKSKKTFKQLQHEALREAVRRWNKRVAQNKKGRK